MNTDNLDHILDVHGNIVIAAGYNKLRQAVYYELECDNITRTASTLDDAVDYLCKASCEAHEDECEDFVFDNETGVKEWNCSSECHEQLNSFA